MAKPRILVVGSCNVDMIYNTDIFPQSGETVSGTTFTTAMGGKGANQAAQTARLGAETVMVGKIGTDDLGKGVLEAQKALGIDVSKMLFNEEVSTGVAAILLEPAPEGVKNRILVIPGANRTFTEADVAYLKDEIKNFDMVILQLEINMEINELVAKYAHDAGVPVMLNSAPSAPLTDAFLANVTYISPNEHEAKDLTGVTIDSMETAKEAILALCERGVANALITWGKNGAVFGNKNEFFHAPCVPNVKVADPTAAGDSFVGAFCTAVCAGCSHDVAMQFANQVAAITVSRMGAQPSLPTTAEVFAAMEERGAACKDDPALRTLLD